MRRRRSYGASFIETVLAVSVAATVAAAFLPAFSRNLQLSRVSEPVQMLAELHNRSAVYFARAFHPEQGPALHRCIPNSAGPIPAEPSATPQQVSLRDVPTFAALGFEDESYTLRYSYSYETGESRCNVAASSGNDELPHYDLAFRATGDLDADGDRSTFERRARITATGLEPVGILYVRDRTE